MFTDKSRALLTKQHNINICFFATFNLNYIYIRECALSCRPQSTSLGISRGHKSILGHQNTSVRWIRQSSGLIHRTGLGRSLHLVCRSNPSLIAIMELDPRIILIMDARTQVGCEIAPFPRVCRSRLDILGKADEERSKDGDGTKDDDEPHLR